MVATIIKGDSADWSFGLTQLPVFEGAPSGAEISAFIRSDRELFPVDSVFKEGQIFVVLKSDVSKNLKVGKAWLILRLTSESEQYQKSAVLTELRIVPEVSDAEFDHRSEAQKCLEQAEAALADYTKGGARVKSYTIGTRATTFNSLHELTDLVEYWRKRVYLESCAQQGIDPRRMLVEFVS